LSDDIRVVFKDEHEARTAWTSELHQGVLTTRVLPPPDQGQQCGVTLDLAFAGESFRLEGMVVHADHETTALWFAAVPPDLRRLCLGDDADGDRLTADLADSLDDNEPHAAGGYAMTGDDLDSITDSADSATDEESEDNAASPFVHPPRIDPQPAVDPAPRPPPPSATEQLVVPQRSAVEETPESTSEPPPATDPGAPAWPSLELPSRDEAKSAASKEKSPTPLTVDAPAAGRNYLGERLRRDAENKKAPPPRDAGSQPAATGAPRRTPWGRSPKKRRGRERGKAPGVDSTGIPIPEGASPLPGIVAFRDKLERTSAYQVLMRVSAEKRTGVAVFDVDDGRYWGYFIGGGPVQFVREPPMVSESTEALLIRKQLVTDAVLEQARRLAALTGRPLVSVVMRLRLISKSQLYSLRADQTRLVTEHLLESHSGSIRFFDVPELREVFQESSSDVTKPLWQHAWRKFSGLGEAEISAQINLLRPQFVSVTDEGKKLLHKLPVNNAQMGFLNKLLRPSRPVSRLFRRLDIKQGEAVCMLLALRQMGIVTLAHKGAENEEEAELERALRERFRAMRKDHFGFLSLHWSALPGEMASACDRFEEELHRFDVIGMSITNYAGMREALGNRLREMRELVDDDKARKQYRAKHVGKAERMMAAETLLKQGEMALFRKDRTQAGECFRRLLEIDPGGAGSHDRLERANLALLQLED